jgi:hypothetical protein
MSPTKGPWRVSAGCCITDAEGNYIGDTATISRSWEEDCANAKHAVKCVNSHTALVKCAKKYHEFLNATLGNLIIADAPIDASIEAELRAVSTLLDELESQQTKERES